MTVYSKPSATSVGIGTFLGSWLAGLIYGNYGEKANLALRYLMEKTSFGAGKSWDGSMGTLESASGVSRTAAMDTLQQITGMDSMAATRMLWETYHPHNIWIPFALTGVVAAVALYIFGRMARKWSDMNA